jgi:hypothetical protein
MFRTSRKMLAAIGTASCWPERRSRLKSSTVYPPKITSPATDQMMFSFGIATKIAMTPEGDQSEQRPEQDAIPRRQVTANRVPGRAEPGDEPAGGARGLPDGRGIGLDIRAQDGTEGQSEQQAEAEQQ